MLQLSYDAPSTGNRSPPLDLSKAYEPDSDEISFSDSNNDESNDYFVTTTGQEDGAAVSHYYQQLSHPYGDGSTNATQPGPVGDLLMTEYQPASPASSTHSQRTAYYYYSTTNNNNNQTGNITNSTAFNSGGGVGNNSGGSGGSGGGKKRFRTQMSNGQVKILRYLFRDLKTPSMTDCENIGREIGLPKRVVQVGVTHNNKNSHKKKHTIHQKTVCTLTHLMPIGAPPPSKRAARHCPPPSPFIFICNIL